MMMVIYIIGMKNVLICVCNNQQQKLERYKNNIKSAFEVINTQMKNLSKEEAENLRIIKFNLIKGSCTWGDLTTEEDYKY